MTSKLFFIVVLTLAAGFVWLPGNGYGLGNLGMKCIRTDRPQDGDRHFYIDCGKLDKDKWRMHCYWYSDQKWHCRNMYTGWEYTTTDDKSTGLCETACGRGATW